MIIQIWNSRSHLIIYSLINIPNNNLKLQIIAYDRRRGGTIVIDKRPGGRTVTSLIISQADVTDSGNYTCDPASNYSKWVIVHVTTGLYLVGYIYKNIHTNFVINLCISFIYYHLYFFYIRKWQSSNAPWSSCGICCIISIYSHEVFYQVVVF